MQAALLIIGSLMLVLGAMARLRGVATFREGAWQGIGQAVKLLPRMLCALIGASFLVRLIPTETISGLLGADAGLLAIVIGALTGVLVPAGPVVSFSIAAAFAAEGASVPALVAFITSWSVHSLHRIVIFEIPLLGRSFLRLRVVSVMLLPFVAGGLTLLAQQALQALQP